MAGSIVQLTIKDGLGNTRTAEFWSDNGLVTGNLVALHQTVDVNGNPITPLAAGGNIAVNNFPATQNVALTGGINITNFPATQIVTGNVNAVVGSVSVSNFPATQNVAVTGNVVLTNSPTIMSTGTGLASKHVLVDGNTGVSAQVQAWHSSDNVALSGTTYGMMTGGVDQIVNVYGNLDRKRGMWGDAQPATGLAAHGMMLWNGASYDRAPGSAAYGLKTNDTSYATHAPAYYQSNVTSNTATLSTLIANTVPTWATMVYVTPETGGIRYRADGVAPTSSLGQPVAVNQSWPIQSAAALAAAQFISQNSSNVVVSFEFRG